MLDSVKIQRWPKLKRFSEANFPEREVYAGLRRDSWAVLRPDAKEE